MRTTLRLDDRLIQEAKRLAARSGRTLASVIEDLLREALARRRAPQSRIPARLPTFRGKGVRPGVDLDDSAALLEWMDGGHAAH